MDSILYTLNLARMGLHPWLLAAAPLGKGKAHNFDLVHLPETDRVTTRLFNVRMAAAPAFQQYRRPVTFDSVIQR